MTRRRLVQPAATAALLLFPHGGGQRVARHNACQAMATRPTGHPHPQHVGGSDRDDHRSDQTDGDRPAAGRR